MYIKSQCTIHVIVMVHNPAHDLFSIGHFLCRVTTPIRQNILSRLGYSL